MIGQTVGDLLAEKATLDIEGIDRMYLNLYQPMLQTGAGVGAFFKGHRGAKVASTALMGPMSRALVKASHDFAKREGIEIVAFAMGGRKDELAKKRLQGFCAEAGVLDIRKAQETFERLPDPFTDEDRGAGFNPQPSHRHGHAQA